MRAVRSVVRGLVGIALCGACAEPSARISSSDDDARDGAADAEPDAAPPAPPPWNQPDPDEDAFVPRPRETCGDFQRDEGEDCDDGNVDNDDGCSARCTWEVASEQDVCPGVVLPLAPIEDGRWTLALEGSTGDVLHQYTGSCGGSGPESVYAITAPTRGYLQLHVDADHDVVLYVRSDCDDTSRELACVDREAAGSREDLAVPLEQGQTAYLFIDGLARSSGFFHMTGEFTRAVCHNGVIELPETCEDFNESDGDGCTEACVVEAGSEVCPGLPVKLRGQDGGERVIRLVESTWGSADNQRPLACVGYGGDRIYGVTTDIAGALHAELSRANNAQTVYIRTGCQDQGGQLICAQSTARGELPPAITAPIEPDRELYVVIDSPDIPGVGDYELTLRVTAAECGNGVLDAQEECDDENTIAGDGCLGCRLEAQNGTLETCPGAPITLQFDGSSAYRGRYSATTRGLTGDHQSQAALRCSTRAAPDAVLHVTPEISGRLQINGTAGFDATVQVRDLCDIERRLTDPALTLPEITALRAHELTCVDDVHGAGGERVNDLPVVAGTLYSVIVSSGSASQSGAFTLDLRVDAAVCGNGYLDGGEQCDDHNLTPGDGCDASCVLEPRGAEATCPGRALPIAFGQTVHAVVPLANQRPSFVLTAADCSVATGNDAVFSVTPARDGVLDIEAQGAGVDFVMAVRASCDSGRTERACANAGSLGEAERLRVPVRANQPYAVIFKGLTPAQNRPLDVDFTLREGRCGDGLLAEDEGCDDGNQSDGDGCSARCAADARSGLDTCPGLLIKLPAHAPGESMLLSSSTAGLSSDTSGSCGGAGRDARYQLLPDETGVLEVRMRSAFDGVLYTRDHCDGEGNGWCSAAPPGQVLLRAFVVEDRPTWLVVDGNGGDAGPYQIRVNLIAGANL